MVSRGKAKAKDEEVRKIPIIICGAQGRMGQALQAELGKSPVFELKAAIARGDELSYEGPGVLIDFSERGALALHAQFALKQKLALLICTTGHDASNQTIMQEAAMSIPVLYAPNTSIMANLLIHMCEIAAEIPGLEAFITDIHHSKKKDAPSGTALALQAAMAPRPVSITSIRTGNVIGEHRVQLFKENEQLELIHRAHDRTIFAEGALIAAQFLFGRAPGLYSMSDMIKLKMTI